MKIEVYNGTAWDGKWYKVIGDGQSFRGFERVMAVVLAMEIDDETQRKNDNIPQDEALKK